MMGLDCGEVVSTLPSQQEGPSLNPSWDLSVRSLSFSFYTTVQKHTILSLRVNVCKCDGEQLGLQ